MNCPACNAEIEANSVFCPKCGERLDGDGGDVGARITAETHHSKTGPGDVHGEAQSPADRFRDQVSPPGDEADDDQEIELWVGGFSPKAMIGWWVGAAVLTVLLIVGIVMFFSVVPAAIAMGVGILLVWLYPACVTMYRRWSLRYRLTTQRFLHEHGMLSRTTDRIEVIDIDDVSYQQSLFDRMVGVGKIRIESGDRTHPVLVLKGIEDVQRVYDLIDDARRKERVRRGIHIATAGRTGL